MGFDVVCLAVTVVLALGLLFKAVDVVPSIGRRVESVDVGRGVPVLTISTAAIVFAVAVVGWWTLWYA